MFRDEESILSLRNVNRHLSNTDQLRRKAHGDDCEKNLAFNVIAAPKI